MFIYIRYVRENTMIQSLRRMLGTALMLLALLVMTFSFATPALAEGGEQAASNTPAGLGVLILVMGLAAIFLIGGYYVNQNRPQPAGDKDFDEDDE